MYQKGNEGVDLCSTESISFLPRLLDWTILLKIRELGNG